jgi:hypothetical protein
LSLTKPQIILTKNKFTPSPYGEGFYYYLDNQAEKTRYLYLDTAYKGLDGIQAEFVKQALLSTPSKWHIVAIAHKWYDTDYTTNPASTGALSANGSTLLSMFDDYNARSGEYASCEGWVEFCIGGHTHWDYDGASDNGIPVILVESSSINDRSGFNPAPGTTTETAISAIIADYDNQKINIIRIGRGTNREVTIGNFIISYVNLLPISLDTSGNIFNNIGYKTESRISGSSGTADATGCCASGYMPCEKLDVVRLENITMSGENGSGHVMIAFYNAIENAIAVSVNITDIKQSGNQCEPVFDGDNLIQFTVPNYPEINDGQVYFRICADVIDDASIVTIGEVILEREEDEDTYTNVLLTAVDSDGSAIDGGYKESNRISGSSGFSGATGCDATGWIACNKGDVIRFYNMTFDLSGGTTHPSIALYAAVQLSTHGVYNYSTLTASDNVWNTVLDGSNIIQVTIPDYSELTSPIYFRVCADDINENTIITINKEI